MEQELKRVKDFNVLWKITWTHWDTDLSILSKCRIVHNANTSLIFSCLPTFHFTHSCLETFSGESDGIISKSKDSTFPQIFLGILDQLAIDLLLLPEQSNWKLEDRQLCRHNRDGLAAETNGHSLSLSIGGFGYITLATGWVDRKHWECLT